MLEVAAVSFDFYNKRLLKNVQFSIESGQLLHLRGANGSGKTTLLKILAGLLQPEQGQIEYDGKNIRDDLKRYQQNLCYIGHKSGLNPLLTVRENCFFDMNCQDDIQNFDNFIANFGLQGLANEACCYLSAGQRRRVSLLRLLMTEKKLWLLDEPLVALDNDAIFILMAYMQNHLIKGGQIIFTSHQTLPIDYAYQEYLL